MNINVMNIQFSYFYRDGANYKNFNTIVFSNPDSISLNSIDKAIRSNLIDATWFYPKVWNIPTMYFKEFKWDAEIDHDWHEFESIKETLEKVTEENSIEDFLMLLNKSKVDYQF